MSDNVNTTNNNSTVELIKNYYSDFSKGIISQNPVFILLLGLCPALAVSTSLTNGIVMGVSVCIVLIFSSTIISIFRKIIPIKIKLFVHIIIISIFVTVIDLLLNNFFPLVSKSLGIYLPLLSINCLILGRAEFFANKNPFGRSILDSFGMGIGFLFSIIIISLLREILSNLELNFHDIGFSNFSFGNDGRILIDLFQKKYEIFSGIKLFLLPAGGFILLGLIVALITGIKQSLIKDNS